MSRIAKCFKSLKSDNKKALIPFFTAGDPSPDITVPLMHAVVDAGADLLELGVPFSDPMAEGPVIQAACERALKHDVSLNNVLDMVRQFRKKDTETPVILMGYLNPIEIMGYVVFSEKAAKAGVDGVLIVDLPPEEADEPINIFRTKDIDLILLAAPTSDSDRLDKIASACSGFVYYVSVKGVTGSSALDVDNVAAKVAEVRQHVSSLPVGVGFGIKDAQSAAQISRIADAVVVGSAIVNRIADHQNDADQLQQSVCDLVKSMREAMDTDEGSK